MIKIEIAGETYIVDISNPIEIAFPLDFKKKQPNVHGIGKATATTHRASSVIGSVKEGGSCNWEQYTFSPHSHGTHTESVGHITKEEIPVHTVLKELLVPIVVVTVESQKGGESQETYFPAKHIDDLLITKKALTSKMEAIPDPFCQAVAIRTLPNTPLKITQDYQKTVPPFFSQEAMEYLVSRQVHHLLVDFPSVDRAHDGGQMINHRLFWNLARESKTVDGNTHLHRTITELIYIPSNIPDGTYALNLQIPCFATDAAPSRPLIFSIVLETAVSRMIKGKT